MITIDAITALAGIVTSHANTIRFPIPHLTAESLLVDHNSDDEHLRLLQ